MVYVVQHRACSQRGRSTVMVEDGRKEERRERGELGINFQRAPSNNSLDIFWLIYRNESIRTRIAFQTIFKTEIMEINFKTLVRKTN